MIYRIILTVLFALIMLGAFAYGVIAAGDAEGRGGKIMLWCLIIVCASGLSIVPTWILFR